MSEHILTAELDRVLTITLHRPEKKNAFTAEMYRALNQALHDANTREDIHVVVIQGDTRTFTAGNDIDDFLHHPPTGPDAPVAQLLYTIADLAKPLIAAVCGPAVGIGTTMLLHCDIVVAGDNAVFAMPFTTLGVSPEGGSSMLLPQLMGYQRAAELLLLGGTFSAADAHSFGLVNRVVAADAALGEAQRIAAQLAALPHTSVLETKRQLKMGQREALRHRMTEEMQVFAELLQQPAAQEALRAFTERKTP